VALLQDYTYEITCNYTYLRLHCYEYRKAPPALIFLSIIRLFQNICYLMLADCVILLKRLFFCILLSLSCYILKNLRYYIRLFSGCYGLPYDFCCLIPFLMIKAMLI